MRFCTYLARLRPFCAFAISPIVLGCIEKAAVRPVHQIRVIQLLLKPVFLYPLEVCVRFVTRPTPVFTTNVMRRAGPTPTRLEAQLCNYVVAAA